MNLENLPPGSRDPGDDCPSCGGEYAMHDLTCPQSTGVEVRCAVCGRGYGYARHKNRAAEVQMCPGCWPEDAA